MARPFSAADAKKAIEKHKNYLLRMQKAVEQADNLIRDIISAADQLAEAEAEAILQNIPVEELNRDLQGIRVKSLRDAGFASMADIHKASLRRVADVRGIADDTAGEIKQQAEAFALKTRKEVRLRLSADDRNPQATKLVTGVFRYKAGLPAFTVCREQFDANHAAIEAAFTALAPVTGGIKWLFAGKEKKEQATLAYDYLSELLEGSYAQRLDEVLPVLDSLKRLQFASPLG